MSLVGGDGDLEQATSSFIAELFAERRWVVSGTPTTGDVDDPAIVRSHLYQLQKLLKWLRHPRYGLDADPRLDTREDAADDSEMRKALFESEVMAPFCDQQSESARATLVALLRTVTVRHRKTDLKLPAPIYENYEVEVALRPGETPDDDSYQWRVDEALADFVVRTKNSCKQPKIAVFPSGMGIWLLLRRRCTRVARRHRRIRRPALGPPGVGARVGAVPDRSEGGAQVPAVLARK